MERKSISIRKKQEQRLKSYVKKTGLKEAEVFRQALDQYLESKKTNQP